VLFLVSLTFSLCTNILTFCINKNFFYKYKKINLRCIVRIVANNFFFIPKKTLKIFHSATFFIYVFIACSMFASLYTERGLKLRRKTPFCIQLMSVSNVIFNINLHLKMNINHNPSHRILIHSNRLTLISLNLIYSLSYFFNSSESGKNKE